MDRQEKEAGEKQRKKQHSFQSRGGNMSVGYNLLSFEYYDDNKGQQQKSLDAKKQEKVAARCNNLVNNS